MIKAAMTCMARYANVSPPRPSAMAPLGRSLVVLRFLTSSPHSRLRNSNQILASLAATHSPSHAEGVYDSSRRIHSASGWSVSPCVASQIDCRLFSARSSVGSSSRHPDLRHPWLAENPIHRRGFASSARDVSGAASPSPAGGPSLPPPAATPSGAEGSASGGSADAIVNVAESTRKGVNSFVEMLVGAREASREAAAHVFPSVDNWMDPSGGGVAELVVPASTAIGVSLVAWLLLPKVLRKFHSYVESGPTARLLGRLPQERQPYELSVFSALEMPARLLASAVTFSYLGYIVAPTSFGAHHLTQIWSGATVLSVIWFLYRWKSNAFARMLSGRTITNPDRERYLTMDRLSSIGLLVLGGMAFAEACGVAVQSILTVGGIGGVATAFAARDILGNMLSGVALQFSRPFTVGDSISVSRHFERMGFQRLKAVTDLWEAGSVNGQVVEMGLHSTQLLNSDKFPIVVPNSFFSNQVIINKSRARYRGLLFNLPVNIKDLEKIPSITSEIRKMMLSHPKVYLENEKPRCHVSQVGPSSLNIAVTCNLKPMGTDDHLAAGEELLIEAARLVTKTGATLGAPA